METIKIGSTGLVSSRIGLGTWAIGGWMWGGTDESESIQTIHKALDEGITLIDTAPVYGFGRSEEIVGKALAEGGRRQRAILATKAGMDWTEGENVYRNASRERIMKEVEDSLRRLQTDVIDIHQVHWPDPHVPIEETAEAMYRLHRDGKIRAIGVSNFNPEQLDRFRDAAPLETLQPPYNLFEREIEEDILPHAREKGLTTLTYGSLCRGLLSGKMSKNRSFKRDDLRQADPKLQEPRFGSYLKAVEELDKWVQARYGKRVIHLALRWVLDHPGVGVALWGARRPEQLDPVPEIDDWNLTDEDRVDIETILDRNLTDPVGPGFMAPPSRDGRTA
ncbi:aryl-alcohol dehydrogenase-like predicted oxidoreductase [Melghirimyces profundicolus]|uniref:Aryl-alcohol dehydrogenase-like predicted oxidoreductase n=1 Tax=Melghirimyces profundicolus TaxID=1242148 RepID=A0A2T6BCE6_9BACL|nr:aldo/keto reductase [Melghirimyces profundicolus]PTX53750.1 aryl-alcohol dehydrogenase-like predicted oxidoreductase [Melghirimyces profundicolus]